MSLIPAFAGRYSALEYWFGGPQTYCPPAIDVLQGNAATGAGTITVSANFTLTQGSTVFSPFVVGQTIQVGLGSALETVTITSVGAASLVGSNPSAYSITIGATFNQIHGFGDPVSSVTFGLQEAINVAGGNGGGIVVITASWYANGGTVAIVQAATLPAGGIVKIEDISPATSNNVGAGSWATSPNSLTVVAAPAAATSATIASLAGVVGTWTATTNHFLYTYVTADGGESLASADYSFTTTVSLAVGGPGPAASAGAVGYRIYAGTNATSACYLVPVIAANGTVIQCGPIAAFKIGTSTSIAAITVASALIPVQSTSFPTGVQPIASPNMAQPFATVMGPFAVTGSVTTGSEWGKFKLPAGWMNQFGRAFLIKLYGYWTPAGTAKLTIAAALDSVYTTTSTTIFTATSAASSGTAIANIEVEIFVSVSATGATGTVEAHGHLIASTATGTPSIAAAIIDSVQAVSSAADLTKQDDLVFTISSDATVTQSQLRRAVIIPLL